MRLFVVLALVALTGCQANVLRSEESKLQLDRVKDDLWDYSSRAVQNAYNTLQAIRESEFVEQVNAKIEESIEVVRTYAANVQEQASVIIQESYKKVSEEVDRLSENLQQDINEVKAQLEPFTEKLRADIDQQVEKARQAVAPYREALDNQALKDTLRQKRRKLEKTLEWSVTELQSLLGPSTEELKEKVEQRLQESKQTMQFLTHSLSDEIFGRTFQLHRTLRPYIKDVEKKLDPYTRDIKSQLRSWWESFTKSAKV